MNRIRAGLVRTLKQLLGEAPRQTICVPVPVSATARRWSQWGSYGKRLRMEVPVSRLVMQGGMHFIDPMHPFQRGLDSGLDGLLQYYSENCPDSLLAWHGLDAHEPGDSRVPPWELPWIQREVRLPPPGEGGLGPEHGVSFYGPVSNDKLRLELGRLQGLVAAIRRDGYRPDLFGDIVGYFMFDECGDFRFFVRGGKHRAAVLAWLGHESVPVAFKPDWPRAVELVAARDWPLVMDGSLSVEAARRVFKQYFQFQGTP